MQWGRKRPRQPWLSETDAWESTGITVERVSPYCGACFMELTSAPLLAMKKLLPLLVEERILGIDILPLSFGGDGKLTAISVHRLSSFSASPCHCSSAKLRSTHLCAGGGQRICMLSLPVSSFSAVPNPRKLNSSPAWGMLLRRTCGSFIRWH